MLFPRILLLLPVAVHQCSAAALPVANSSFEVHQPPIPPAHQPTSPPAPQPTYGSYGIMAMLYGTSLNDWKEMSTKMWPEGTLAPLPIRQELHLIKEISLTKAAAASTHSNGSTIDNEQLQATAIESLQKDCSTLDCDISVCSSILKLDSPTRQYLFEDYGRSLEGRPIFKDRVSGHFLFYSQKKWNIGPTYEAEDTVLATSLCPHNGAVFEDAIAEPSYPKIKSWKACAKLCLDSKPPAPGCNYWQYEAATERCTLISDYARMVSNTSDTYTGSKDCPGHNSSQFAYGHCAETHVSRSMWVDHSSAGFLKGLEINKFDPTTIVIAGGYSSSSGTDNVYAVANKACHLPRLPTPTYEHSLVLTAHAELLSCGGVAEEKTCYSLDVAGGVWSFHSSLTQKRKKSTAITLPSGTYIFGGGDSRESRTTSDYLPASSQTWQAGPTIPGDGIYEGCGVKVSPTELLLIGGGDTSDRVIKYTEGQGWLVMPSLRHARHRHSCALIGNTVVVAGGSEPSSSSSDSSSSTEIIPLDTYQPRPGGNLRTARYGHSLVTVGGRQPRLLAMGRYKSIERWQLASIEEWDEDSEEWRRSSLTLNTEANDFGALAVPPITICSKK